MVGLAKLLGDLVDGVVDDGSWSGIKFPKDQRVRKSVREAFVVYERYSKRSSPFVLVVEHGIGE